MTLPLISNASTREGLAGPAVKAFSRISSAWGLTEPEQMKILGISDRRTLRRWKEGRVRRIAPETLERISYVIGIFEAINTLLPQPERADAWMRKPNSAPLFNGATAIERMTSAGTEGLRSVRRYLDAQLAGSS